MYMTSPQKKIELNKPSFNEGIQYPLEGSFDEFDSISFAGGEKTKGTDFLKITLFIPGGLNYTRGYTYDEEESSALSQAMKADSFMGGIGEALKQKIGGAINKGLDTIGGRQALAQQGFAYNPNMEVYFKGSQFRTLSFEFPFLPKSPKEASAVKKITDSFELYSMPVITGGKQLFKYPYIWNISCRKIGISSYFNSKNCVLENVTISYGGEGGFNTFIDGAPVKSVLKLDFKEIELWSREDKTS